ncbi:MAG: glycosyltransferase family 2 protein [Bacteroidota bacterium]
MAKRYSISLIISTYNRPDALELILLSVLKQTVLPHEVIIADDGSRQETQQLIEQYKASFPLPLVHVWHEDAGFRLSVIKNKAVAKATSDYVIFIDGDLVIHRNFIEDYSKNIKPNSILVASRVFLSEGYTKELLSDKNASVIINNKTVEKNKIASYRIPWLHHLIKGSQTYKGARGGLMGVFKSDFVKVNGFDESFTGWGREDSDLYVRLLNTGVKRFNIKFAAITYHLWHKEISRDKLSLNDRLLEESIKQKRTWCPNGIDKYL